MTSISFHKRTFYLLAFFLLWAFLALCHVFYYSVWKQDHYKKESGKLGWKEFGIPALRGCIRDKNNVPIVENRVRYDLVLVRVPSTEKGRKKRKAQLKKMYPDFLFELPEDAEKNVPWIDKDGFYCGMILKKALSSEEVLYYTKMERGVRDFSVKAVFYRKTKDFALPSAFREKLGRTSRDENGFLYGESGLEKEYDLLLRGTPGRIRVMLDKYGFWVMETIKIIKYPVRGRDLILPLSVEELQKGKLLPEKWKMETENGRK